MVSNLSSAKTNDTFKGHVKWITKCPTCLQPHLVIASTILLGLGQL